jgi:lipopolysaccharide transport system permease protein
MITLRTSPPQPAADPGAGPRPHLTIRPTRGWSALNLRELWLFRDLLTTLAIRDIKLRYRQTALGVAWVILQPLIAAGIFTFVFDRLAKLPSDGTPYFAFAFAGQIAWGAFANTLGKSSASLVQNAALVSKVFFPRLILPLSTLFATLIDFGVGLAIMAALMLMYGLAPGWGVLLLPVWLALILLLASGVGLAAAALMVRYRDVAYVMPVLVSLLTYASPVGYSISAVPAGALPAYLLLNPLASLLSAFRWSLLGNGALPEWGYILYAAVVAVLFFVGGALMFRKMERTFADVI